VVGSDRQQHKPARATAIGKRLARGLDRGGSPAYARRERLQEVPRLALVQRREFATYRLVRTLEGAVGPLMGALPGRGQRQELRSLVAGLDRSAPQWSGPDGATDM
jgi:hypothetical protein